MTTELHQRSRRVPASVGRYLLVARDTTVDADVDLEAWRQAWKLGGRDALLRSGELAGLVPRLEELIHLYQSQEID